VQHLRLESWNVSRAAQQRCQEKSVTTVASESRRPMAANNNARKQKKLNLRTYKNHALSDYVDTIRCIGTTDSYSTQPVSFYMMFCTILLTVHGGHQSELEHRTSKTCSLRTCGRSIPLQISRVERRERHISMIRERLNRPRLSLPTTMEPEDVAHDPGVQYNIGKSQKCPVHIPTFLKKNEGDPAIKASSLHILLFNYTNPSDAGFFTKVKRASTSSNPNGASPGN
jgi:hypothetical protein